ncbi:MAG TPA: helix-turn-helix domain-containing protein, partial [Gemmatimonadaceae bacterium]|nr:helix-turn-helix domain-containing protein [Gemmatimonadaceae bacterium]
ERREDVPVLVEHFVAKHSQRAGKRIDGLEPGVLEALQSADWPGNVRELENTVERAVVLSPSRMIGPDVVRILGVSSATPAGLPSLNLRQNLDWAERETVRRALDNSGGVKKDAAEAMGISQRALSYYLAKHRVE